MRIIRAADYATMPWKNGGGTTTEIAVSPPGAALSDFDWRISMAHVGADGPFSSFPGIDRTLSLLGGQGLALVFDDGETVELDRSSEPFFFAADRAVSGRLTDGPIDDLNVMSRRGRWTHNVSRLTNGTHQMAAGRGLLILVTRRGAWHVNGEGLVAGDSAVLDGPGTVELTIEGAGELFAVTLSPVA